MSSSRLDYSLIALQGTAKERREAFDLAEQRRTLDRQKLIAEQASPRYSAVQRIRLWEQLHNLRLPRRPDHPLVDVIADGTSLTTVEVRAEQTRRLDVSSAHASSAKVG